MSAAPLNCFQRAGAPKPTAYDGVHAAYIPNFTYNYHLPAPVYRSRFSPLRLTNRPLCPHRPLQPEDIPTLGTRSQADAMFRAQSNIFDDVVTKATDENLTSENWEYILVISLFPSTSWSQAVTTPSKLTEHGAAISRRHRQTIVTHIDQIC